MAPQEILTTIETLKDLVSSKVLSKVF